MYWILEISSKLDFAPWPATKEELIDYAERSGAMPQVIENLKELENDGEEYYGIKDLWPDVPESDDEFGWDPDEH